MILRTGICVLLAWTLGVFAPAPCLDLTDQMSPAMQSAVDRGLAYIAATQRREGNFGNGEGRNVGVTACCALAFMAYGHLPGTGKYGVNTSRALEFLLENAQPDGLIFRPGSGNHPMYHHALGTLAIAEAWGQTGDRRLRDALRKAIDLICATQNHKGGWRYQPKVADDDLSVTVMMLMALRAAKDAGMEVPKEVIDGGIAYVKMCHNGKGAGKDGGFSYTPGGNSGWARTGAGITSLQVAGNYKAAEVIEGIEYILEVKPTGAKPIDEERWYYYGLYYATMGLYQGQSLGAWGKRAWDRWYPLMVTDVLGKQLADGHWKGDSEPYPTAMSLLTLAVPYRYLPIYQR